MIEKHRVVLVSYAIFNRAVSKEKYSLSRFAMPLLPRPLAEVEEAVAAVLIEAYF